METQTLEFSPVKTLKLINKDSLLKVAFENTIPSFNFLKLQAQAKEDKLPKDTLDTLKEIFDEVITVRYEKDYEEIKEVKTNERRYGKVQVEKDIKAQGGVATENQLTKLALNDLKSMFLNLDGKATSDHYRGTNKITEAEGRTIRSLVLSFAKATKDIRARKVGK